MGAKGSKDDVANATSYAAAAEQYKFNNTNYIRNLKATEYSTYVLSTYR